MQAKFYHNLGDVVKVSEDITLADNRCVTEGTLCTITSIKFEVDLALYNVAEYPNVEFVDADFESGKSLKIYDMETHKIQFV